MEECQRLLSAVSGPDQLIVRILIQLGLRSEEPFALRRDDVVGDMLRIDEALVEGASARVKTEAAEASVYVPPDLQVELRNWLSGSTPQPHSWLFPSPKGSALGLQKLLESRVETRCDSRKSRRIHKANAKRSRNRVDRRELPSLT